MYMYAHTYICVYLYYFYTDARSCITLRYILSLPLFLPMQTSNLGKKPSTIRMR